MTILCTGLLYWLVTWLAVIRLGKLFPAEDRGRRRGALLALLLLLGAGLLLFRPHEDFLGGQDQGAYVNAALTYARRQAFSYVDPLLSRVQETVRPHFFYGDETFPQTKYMVFHVADVSSGRVATWFQPSYPALMSVVAMFGSDRGILYVAPLFALLTGIALWILARPLLRHPWAGPVAFVFYVLNPITVWHGRGARAEAPAAFFIFAGCALLVHVWLRVQKARSTAAPLSRQVWPDILLASLCINLAPLFHASAWLVAIPAGVVALLLCCSGFRVFRPYGVGILPGVGGWVLQSVFVADPYGCAELLKVSQQHLPGTVGCVLVAATALAAACISVHRRHSPATMEETRGLKDELGWLLALTPVVVFALSYAGSLGARRMWGGLGGVGLLHLTDARGLVTAISLPVALAALAGWVVFVVRPGETKPIRIVFAFAMLPALLLGGAAPILMYFLRRMWPFVVPLLALSVASLIVSLAARSPSRRVLAAGLAVWLAGCGVYHRSALFSTRDYEGLLRCLRPVAERVQADDGILLAEYSRLAAPFEHAFGIPTLAFDNEHQLDYQDALHAWRKIMQAEPRRAAFFITPFGEPVSDFLQFEPVMKQPCEPAFLETSARRLPRHVRRPPLTLSLYRMTLREPAENGEADPLPYLREVAESNMGLREFAAGRSRVWPLEGITVGPGVPVTIALPERPDSNTSAELLLFFHDGTEMPPRVVAENSGTSLSGSWMTLGGPWWFFRSVETNKSPGGIIVSADRHMLLTDAVAIVGGRAVPLPLDAMDQTVRQESMFTRWSRSSARILTPLPSRPRGLVLLLVHPSRPESVPVPGITIAADGLEGALESAPLPARWSWTVFPAFRDNIPGPTWMTLTTQDPWNSQDRGLPSDLGILVDRIAVLDSPEEAP